MKILIIHATAGVGHKKAAEAIFNGVRTRTSHRVSVIDSLDYTHPWFKFSYAGTYEFMATKLPLLWAKSFEILDYEWIQPLMRFARRIYNGLNTQRLVNFLMEEEFDWVISTHFMSTEVCNHLKGQGKLKSKVLTVVTDYDAHHIWLAPHIDHYATSCQTATDRLIQLGIPEQKITTTGMPVDEGFAVPKSREELAAQFGLSLDKLTFLITSSSFGCGPIEEVVDLLKDHQCLVICGKNQSLFERMKAKESESVKVFKFVDNMPEFMAASDIIITKPGGLTVSESLVCGLPMIFFTAIPGQEENNIRIMEKEGVGFRAFSIDRIKEVIAQITSSPEVLDQLRQRVRQVGKPDAVQTVIKLLV